MDIKDNLELDRACCEAMQKGRATEAVEHLLRQFAKLYPGLVQSFMHPEDRSSVMYLLDIPENHLETAETHCLEAYRSEVRFPERPLKRVLINTPGTSRQIPTTGVRFAVNSLLGAQGMLIAQAGLRAQEQLLLTGLQSRLHLLLYHFGKLKDAVSYDHLTGLYNRRYFEEQLDKILALSRRHRFHVCVALLDLDRFKQINDDHGHRAGDEVLRQVAGLLYRCLRGTEIISRFGGDEFAMIIQYADRNAAELLGQRILDGFSSEPIMAEGQSFQLNASLGMAITGADEKVSGPVLTHRADQAMFTAKESWGNTREMAP